MTTQSKHYHAEAESRNSALLAFDVTIEEYSSVVFAANAAQARWRAVKIWRDVGLGGRREWPSVRASRNPRLDGFSRKEESRCWDPEYVRSVCPDLSK